MKRRTEICNINTHWHCIAIPDNLISEHKYKLGDLYRCNIPWQEEIHVYHNTKTKRNTFFINILTGKLVWKAENSSETRLESISFDHKGKCIIWDYCTPISVSLGANITFWLLPLKITTGSKFEHQILPKRTSQANAITNEVTDKKVAVLITKVNATANLGNEITLYHVSDGGVMEMKKIMTNVKMLPKCFSKYVKNVE